MCQKKVSVETRHPGCGAIRLFFHRYSTLKAFFMIHLLVCTATNLVKWILSVSFCKACSIRGAVFHGAGHCSPVSAVRDCSRAQLRGNIGDGSGFLTCSVWFFGSGSCSNTTSLSTHAPPSTVN